jgi:Rap1a immunity proteins
MRSLALTLVTLMLSPAVIPANPPQESKFQFPKDGNGLLDYCGEVVNLLDSSSTQVDAETEMKSAWCVGYIQATEERILYWRMSAAIQVMAYQQDGKPAPSHMWADEDFVSTCIPDEAPVAQLTRVVVKWLREHPEKLHELKGFLVIEALKSAFPCPAPVKEPMKPTAVKP